jgi:hypothetical protein
MSLDSRVNGEIKESSKDDYQTIKYLGLVLQYIDWDNAVSAIKLDKCSVALTGMIPALILSLA